MTDSRIPPRIHVGDPVVVYFDQPPPLTGTVLYMPQSAGDCWIIETPNLIVYVQRCNMIVKEKRA